MYVQHPHSIQSKAPYSRALSNCSFIPKASSFNGSKLAGQTSTHLAHLIQGKELGVRLLPSAKASTPLDVLEIGVSKSNCAPPIIGPPTITFSGALVKPPAASTTSLSVAPMGTMKF